MCDCDWQTRQKPVDWVQPQFLKGAKVSVLRLAPYPEGDSITPDTHSFHTAGRVWGAVCTGIPNAPWGQRTMGENGE